MKRILEESFYNPVKMALEKEFKKIGNCYFEVTAKGKISSEIKDIFDDVALYIIKVERFSPDIMGYIIKGLVYKPLNKILSNKKELIIVEVKQALKIKDIYQAKQYGEIFNAKYALLIYLESIPVEIKRFLDKRPEILSHSAGYQNVILAQFDKQTQEIIKNSWYRSSPFREDFILKK
jgi:hypothetical protein